LKGFGESAGIGDIGDEGLGTFRCQRLQMGRVSADDTDVLSTGKKIVGDDVSGVSTCSEYNLHKVTSIVVSMQEGGNGLGRMR